MTSGINNIKNIAVFIDGDNISASHYQKIIDELKQVGRILTQRLYADFSRPTSNAWREYIMNYGIDAIQSFRISKKESTDNCLIVDCMRTLYHHQMIEMFVIVSSDSDFSSLASEIRMMGKFCVGVGYHHTPLKLRNNCDRFIVIETLNNGGDSEPKNKSKNEKKKKEENVCGKDEKTEINIYFANNPKFISVKKMVELYPYYNYLADENIIVKDEVAYWLRIDHFKDNIRDIILKVIEESDRHEIHMSWLKDKLLTIDSSFDQRMWGFTKMTDFASMIIHAKPYILTKDKNGEFVIRVA